MCIYIYIYILVWTRAYTCTLSSRLGDCGPSITLLGSFSAWLAELCRVKIYYVATAFAEFFLSGMLCGPVGSRCVVGGLHRKSHKNDPKRVRGAVGFPFFLCNFLKQKWRFRRRSKGPPKLQIGSEGTPKGFRGSEVAPKRTRRASRVLLEGSDGAPKGFWNGPKGSQGALEGFRRGPKGSRRGPEGPPQGSRRASGFGREIGGPNLGVRSGSRSVNTDVCEGPPGPQELRKTPKNSEKLPEKPRKTRKTPKNSEKPRKLRKTLRKH